MKANRGMLEDQLEKYEGQLKGLNSFIKELNDMCAKHGTNKEQLEEDLTETGNNIKYYEGEIARIKQEIKRLPEAQPLQGVADTILPKTAKQGVGSFIVSAISFVAGALVGARLKSGKSKKDGAE